MPSSKGYVRNYKQEYASESPKRRADRAARNRAHYQVEKDTGREVPKGFDVDHKRPLSKGGGNDPSNLQVQRASNNRSYPRTKSGKMKSKRD